jgi:hypothetical protein
MVLLLAARQGGVDGTRTRDENNQDRAEIAADHTPDTTLESPRLETVRVAARLEARTRGPNVIDFERERTKRR